MKTTIQLAREADIILAHRYEIEQLERFAALLRFEWEAAQQTPEERGYVPLSDDGKSVFIDGIGEVYLNFAQPAAQPQQEPRITAGGGPLFDHNGVIAARQEQGQTPFANCRFRICDLPGQCKGEGKCHHPAVPSAAQPQPLTDEQAMDLLPTNTSMSRTDALLWVLRATERAHNIRSKE